MSAIIKYSLCEYWVEARASSVHAKRKQGKLLCREREGRRREKRIPYVCLWDVAEYAADCHESGALSVIYKTDQWTMRENAMDMLFAERIHGFFV